MIITKEQQMFMENVHFKAGKEIIGLRFTNSVAGVQKNHFNIKLFTKNSNDSVEIKLDKDSLAVDRRDTELGIKSSDKRKLYKRTIDEISGALQYSKKEVTEYFEKENKSASDATHDHIQEKFSEFEKLDPKEKQKYIDKALKLSKAINESGRFEPIEF